MKQKASKVRKGSSSKNDNPLGAARGKRNVESLWHSKSRAGFELFVEYYKQQPEGVVGSKDDSLQGVIELGRNSQTSWSSKTTSKGMSRASKRRKKRIGATMHDEILKEDQEENDHKQSSDTTILNLLPEWKMLPDVHLLPPYMLAFLAALSRPLPINIRIRSYLDEEKKEEIASKLRAYSEHIERLSWNSLVYQTKHISKQNLAKDSPDLYQMILEGSKNGTLARQELGSCLPVHFLQLVGAISPSSRVLDLCAAPGNKTLQALEIAQQTGRVRANDVSAARIETLREAIGRSGVPFVERIKYIQNDASKFQCNKLYDAVICDVPCSGSGTSRKDKYILPQWKPGVSNSLHSLQVSILRKALQCVRVGGTVCYSTCSLNPIEDEAVVLAAISAEQALARDHSFQLLEYPGGPRLRPGVKHWKVADYTGEVVGKDERPQLRWYPCFQEAIDGGMENAIASMWPPIDISLPLERCCRLLPQDNDSGGFFLALIQKQVPKSTP